MNGSRLNRVQNLAIFLLALAAAVLIVNLPLFGNLSDASLLELARERLRREAFVQDAPLQDGASPLALPVRIVYANSFARLGMDLLTTQSDEFERAGTYLSEALGSANAVREMEEAAFLRALWGEGLYFDFAVPLPTELLSGLLGVTAPEEPTVVRRALLSPAEEEAVLLVQDGAGLSFGFETAVSSANLRDFLASQSGNRVDFAGLLGPEYARLSPYTLVLSEPSRGTLSVSNALSGSEDAIFRRAEFNPHTENRFTESSGTVIVREVSSALYLRPDGTVSYQGGELPTPGSIYFVPAADSGAPTLYEAAAAAQRLASALLQDAAGSASLFLSGVRRESGRFELSFDLIAGGVPIRYADGSHAASVTVEGQRITAFTVKVRRYAFNEDQALLLPFSQAASIARLWDGAELITAYVDNGFESISPVWLAE